MSMRTTGRSQLLRKLLADLDGTGICILNGYEQYPDVISSDVDILATPLAHSELMDRIQNGPYELVQAIQYEHNSTRYELVTSDKPPVFLGIDVSTDIRSQGRIFFQADEFIHTAHTYKGLFSVPRPDLEFAAYFLKKVLKRELTDSHGLRLSNLWRQDPGGCYARVLNLLPEPRAAIVAKAATTGDWVPVRERLDEFRRILLHVAGLKHPLRVVHYWLSEISRWANRILRPAGLMIVFLGPDGVGKSSVISRLRTELAPAFKGRTKAHHLRPGLVGRKANASDGANPHAKMERGVVMSLVKLGVWWLDYTLGYWVDVFPKMVRATLVTFDRYFDDLLVDPKRYRFKGPEWLVHLTHRMLPRPDLVVLLDAPPEVICSRKEELPYDEVVRLRAKYRVAVSSLPNGHIVDASGSIDQVVFAVEDLVLQHMNQRTARRIRNR